MTTGFNGLRAVLLACAVVFASGCKGGGDGASTSSTAIVPSTPVAPATPAPNAAPTISGTATQTVKANVAYAFTPVASDANGDTLSFEIQNKPSWATFNTVTGQLSGTPMADQIGSYSNIVITASDGQQSASLAAFAITVDAGTPTGATVAWVAPTQNVDGSPLTDLAGFVIAYGASEDALTQTVRIKNPSIDRYLIEDLAAGTYYFGVIAFTASGAESEMSVVGSKVIE